MNLNMIQTPGNITIEKGSITINGVSLTVVNSGINTFSVAIIPYTYKHTNFNFIKVGDIVNLEFDMIGKYIKKNPICFFLILKFIVQIFLKN